MGWTHWPLALHDPFSLVAAQELASELNTRGGSVTAPTDGEDVYSFLLRLYAAVNTAIPYFLDETTGYKFITGNVAETTTGTWTGRTRHIFKKVFADEARINWRKNNADPAEQAAVPDHLEPLWLVFADELYHIIDALRWRFVEHSNAAVFNRAVRKTANDGFFGHYRATAQEAVDHAAADLAAANAVDFGATSWNVNSFAGYVLDGNGYKVFFGDGQGVYRTFGMFTLGSRVNALRLHAHSLGQNYYVADVGGVATVVKTPDYKVEVYASPTAPTFSTPASWDWGTKVLEMTIDQLATVASPYAWSPALTAIGTSGLTAGATNYFQARVVDEPHNWLATDGWWDARSCVRYFPYARWAWHVGFADDALP